MLEDTPSNGSHDIEIHPPTMGSGCVHPTVTVGVQFQQISQCSPEAELINQLLSNEESQLSMRASIRQLFCDTENSITEKLRETLRDVENSILAHVEGQLRDSEDAIRTQIITLISEFKGSIMNNSGKFSSPSVCFHESGLLLEEIKKDLLHTAQRYIRTDDISMLSQDVFGMLYHGLPTLPYTDIWCRLHAEVAL